MRVVPFVRTTLIPSLLLLAACPFAMGQAAQKRVVNADLAHVTGPHSKAPMLVVGAGRAEEGLRADWQAQLATVQSDIGFHYLRMHGHSLR